MALIMMKKKKERKYASKIERERRRN